MQAEEQQQRRLLRWEQRLRRCDQARRLAEERALQHQERMRQQKLRRDARCRHAIEVLLRRWTAACAVAAA